MQITRDHMPCVAFFNGHLRKIKYADLFTHELVVSSDQPVSISKIDQLIKENFMEGSNQTDSTFEFSNGGVDPDGEGGWGIHSIIENMASFDIDRFKTCVTYKLKLGEMIYESY